MLRKLALKCLGLYRICDAVKEKRSYLLKKRDRSRLDSTFAGDIIEEFHPQQQLRLDYTPNLDQKVVPTLEDFLTTNDDDLSNIIDNFLDYYAVICFLLLAIN